MFKKGTKVVWNWGSHKARGKVLKSFKKDVTEKIKGKVVKRRASEDGPAYEVEQDKGNKVLKSESELKKAS